MKNAERKPSATGAKRLDTTSASAPKYVQCHLQFLRKKGIEVHDQDLDRNAMEIAAMTEGIFTPDPSPYLTEELEQHLERLGLDEGEEDF